VLASDCLLAPDEVNDVFFDFSTTEEDVDADNEAPGLSYRIPRDVLQRLRNSKNTAYWSHTFYQNAQGE